MSYPKNPNTIVVKNKYYPNGLSELDVWNYYQKIKPIILKETMGRNIMFMIMTEENKAIIKRKDKDGKTIRLLPKNYDDLITGRTVSIHSGMNGYESFGIIDIDISETTSFDKAKKAAFDVYNFVIDKLPIVSSAKIRFTGKSSFHIVCEFNKKMKVDAMKFLIEKFLRQSDLSRIYTINEKRRTGIVNLDLDRNCYNCNYITLGSLSILGLRCMEVPYNSLMGFHPNEATIK